MDDLTVWQALLTVHNGRTVSGSYAVQHGMVRVKAARGEKARRLDEGLHPIWLAGRLLSELAAEGNAEKGIHHDRAVGVAGRSQTCSTYRQQRCMDGRTSKRAGGSPSFD